MFTHIYSPPYGVTMYGGAVTAVYESSSLVRKMVRQIKSTWIFDIFTLRAVVLTYLQYYFVGSVFYDIGVWNTFLFHNSILNLKKVSQDAEYSLL